MSTAKTAVREVMRVDGSSDMVGSVFNDIIVQKNCSLRIRGNLEGSLTIEKGANVVVEGSVEGKVTNRGGKLVIKHKGIADLARTAGPPELEAGGVLKISLSAISSNWDAIAARTMGECAAVVKADAYGCGIEPVTATLARSGCKTFFVSDLAEAKRARTVAPNSAIYVLNGLYAGSGPGFAAVSARPVISSLIELAEWDAFVASSQWAGEFALCLDTGVSRRGLSPEEAASLAARAHSPTHGIALLMSHLDSSDNSDHALTDRQIRLFQEIRRLYGTIPASLANSFGIFSDPRAHFDLVRPGGALFGINPSPEVSNPMLPVVELQARISQVRSLLRGETLTNDIGWTAKRATRVAVASVGYADGFPRRGNVSHNALQAVVDGQLCPLLGCASMDMLAIDVTELSAGKVVRRGEMVTLIGGEISIDNVAAAVNLSGREVLSHLGHRFHRVYHVGS